MIPLTYALIFWLILLGIHALISFVSVVQMIRFSVAGPMVYVSTIGFLAVSLLVILTSGAFLLGVDWTQTIDFGLILSNPFALPQ